MHLVGCVTVVGRTEGPGPTTVIAVDASKPTTITVHISSTDWLGTIEPGDEFDVQLDLRRPRHAAAEADADARG